MVELYSLYKLSQEYSDYENYAGVEFTLQQMMQLKTEILGRNYIGCDFDLYNLGLVNTTLKRYERARRLLIRALQIQKEHKSHNKLIDVSETLEILAHVRKEKRASYINGEKAAQFN